MCATADRKTSRSKSKADAAQQAQAARPRLARSERLNARITADDQVLLAKVAGMQGISVSTFVGSGNSGAPIPEILAT